MPIKKTAKKIIKNLRTRKGIKGGPISSSGKLNINKRINDYLTTPPQKRKTKKAAGGVIKKITKAAAKKFATSKQLKNYKMTSSVKDDLKRVKTKEGHPSVSQGKKSIGGGYTRMMYGLTPSKEKAAKLFSAQERIKSAAGKKKISVRKYRKENPNNINVKVYNTIMKQGGLKGKK